MDYIYAYDPKIKRRVPHVVLNKRAISLATGHSFKFKKTPEMLKDEAICALREKLASLEHDQWFNWSQQVACNEKRMSKKRLNRWRQLWVAYKDLPESDKESDRMWADKVLDLLLEGLDG